MARIKRTSGKRKKVATRSSPIDSPVIPRRSQGRRRIDISPEEIVENVQVNNESSVVPDLADNDDDDDNNKDHDSIASDDSYHQIQLNHDLQIRICEENNMSVSLMKKL